MNLIISDLFFNQPHPTYDSLFDSPSEITREMIKEAILVDAQEFVNSYNDALIAKHTAEEYAEDFLARL